MAPRRKLLYFVFVFFFMLASCPSGCQAGLEYSQPFPGGEQAETPKNSIPQIQVKRGGAYRSRYYVTNATAKDSRTEEQALEQLSLSGGEFAACESCRLGRGKCRRMCTEDEKVVGSCKLNYFCCRRMIN